MQSSTSTVSNSPSSLSGIKVLFAKVKASTCLPIVPTLLVFHLYHKINMLWSTISHTPFILGCWVINILTLVLFDVVQLYCPWRIRYFMPSAYSHGAQRSQTKGHGYFWPQPGITCPNRFDKSDTMPGLCWNIWDSYKLCFTIKTQTVAQALS